MNAPAFDGSRLARDLMDARRRTLELVADLEGDQWIGPELDEVNPPLWEIGHVAWFADHHVLRTLLGRALRWGGADAAYDSMAIEHHDRWVQVLQAPAATRRYMQDVLDDVLALLDGEVDARIAYAVRLATLHEDMHTEALLYTRQTLALPSPALTGVVPAASAGAPCPGDLCFDGGEIELGAAPGPLFDGDCFVFDNEKWAHRAVVAPFALARAPVTEVEFAAFVDDDGYRRQQWWSEDGAAWRARVGADGPAYWRRDGAGWSVREYDAWRPLAAHRPMLHVNWFEAQAYCRWAGRRLPTEAEWEFAAGGGRRAAAQRPRRPWGAEADLGMRSTAPAALRESAGDGPVGMFGGGWEWTSSAFGPFPGFAADQYRDYSAPWFHSRRVLRGGAFATQARLLTTTHRNFFTPDRRDVFAGFRTAAR